MGSTSIFNLYRGTAKSPNEVSDRIATPSDTNISIMR